MTTISVPALQVYGATVPNDAVVTPTSTSATSPLYFALQTPYGGATKSTAVNESDANVYGISYKFHWSDIESVDGMGVSHYDFSALGSLWTRANNKSKRFMIRIMTGAWAPPDLLVSNHFYVPAAGPDYPPTAAVPFPWQDSYLTRLEALITALGAAVAPTGRLSQRPTGALDPWIQMTGVGALSEMNLPDDYKIQYPDPGGRYYRWAEKADQSAGGPQGSQSSLNYLLLNAWKRVINKYVSVFPSTTPLILDLDEPVSPPALTDIVGYAFGSLNPWGPTNVLQPLLSWVKATYCPTGSTPRISIQCNAIDARVGSPVGVTAPGISTRANVREASLWAAGTAYQPGNLWANGNLGQTSMPYSVSDVTNELAAFVTDRCSYAELFAVDIDSPTFALSHGSAGSLTGRFTYVLAFAKTNGAGAITALSASSQPLSMATGVTSGTVNVAVAGFDQTVSPIYNALVAWRTPYSGGTTLQLPTFSLAGGFALNDNYAGATITNPIPPGGWRELL